MDNEIRHTSVELSQLYPLIYEQLQAGGEVKFAPRGTSMLPTIREKIDSVQIIKAPQKLKKYDAVFYRRKSGQFVLHRVISVEKDGTYTMCGDNQFYREKGIEHSQIIAIVTKIIRPDKIIDCESDRDYIKRVKKRVKQQFIKGTVIRIKSRIKGMAKKFLKLFGLIK